MNNYHGSMNNIQDSLNNTQQSNSNDSTFQVPPSVVRGIVITVLQNQGILDPSEEILQKAIQEYYTKNPQGVNSKASSPATNYQPQLQQTRSQPYRTAPLVTPSPKTVNKEEDFINNLEVHSTIQHQDNNTG